MRKLTAEQQSKTEKRRAAFKEIVKKVVAMDAAQRATIVDRCGAILTCEGRALSVFNTILLLNQRDEVSLVGGFQQWKRAGRQVKKGEHGMMIWFPSRQASDEPTGDEAEMRFFVGTVFDVSQTEESKPEEQV